MPHANNTFIYNPFHFATDTLNNILSINSGQNEIEWNEHPRVWVGDTKYYKSGFTVDFAISDTNLTVSNADSIHLSMRHYMTFPENGEDSLTNDYASFDIYMTDGQDIDINNSATFGSLIDGASLNIKGEDDYWTFPLPADLISDEDTLVGLGVFPTEQGFLSTLYGGATTIKPQLLFYFHEPDSAGEDSVTWLTYPADTLIMDLYEKDDFINRNENNYLSQLTNDTLVYTLNLEGIKPGGDTLMHIVSSSFLPGIDLDASELYLSTTSDSLQRFSVKLLDTPDNPSYVEVELFADSLDFPNSVRVYVQSALDEDKDELDLILKPLYPGYGPGFLVFSNDESQSSLSLNSSMAVQP